MDEPSWLRKMYNEKDYMDEASNLRQNAVGWTNPHGSKTTKTTDTQSNKGPPTEPSSLFNTIRLFPSRQMRKNFKKLWVENQCEQNIATKPVCTARHQQKISSGFQQKTILEDHYFPREDLRQKTILEDHSIVPFPQNLLLPVRIEDGIALTCFNPDGEQQVGRNPVGSSRSGAIPSCAARLTTRPLALVV